MFNSLNDIDATLKKKKIFKLFLILHLFILFISVPFFSTSYLFLNYNFDVLKIFFFYF